MKLLAVSLTTMKIRLWFLDVLRPLLSLLFLIFGWNRNTIHLFMFVHRERKATWISLHAYVMIILPQGECEKGTPKARVSIEYQPP